MNKKPHFPLDKVHTFIPMHALGADLKLRWMGAACVACGLQAYGFLNHKMPDCDEYAAAMREGL